MCPTNIKEEPPSYKVQEPCKVPPAAKMSFLTGCMVSEHNAPPIFWVTPQVGGGGDDFLTSETQEEGEKKPRRVIGQDAPAALPFAALLPFIRSSGGRGCGP